MGVEEIVIACGSPWQSACVERLIGPIRRKCLDHWTVLYERHRRCILPNCFDYDHHARAHSSPDRKATVACDVEPPDRSWVIAILQAGGLHHRYRRAA